MDIDTEKVVEAVRDLTLVTILVHGEFGSRAEAIRFFSDALPPSRLAAIFGIPAKDVTSVLAKAKKKRKGRRHNG